MGEDLKNIPYELVTWRSLYALADFIQDTGFKDALIDALIDWMTTWKKWPLKVATYIYPYSKQNSPHRQLAVDLFVNVQRRELISDRLDQQMEFMQDIIKAIAPNLQDGIKCVRIQAWFKGLDGCKYHDHGDKPCYKTKPAFRF